MHLRGEASAFNIYRMLFRGCEIDCGQIPLTRQLIDNPPSLSENSFNGG